ncbi:MAG TPA: class I SAM-dependent methyltransferase [Rhodopila sp.]|uniref:class I SAM-dependent methyltransferase n=1 Tax=Rhodopila sp. TaxID=2480087 RepID=UPI002C0D5A69|nr:class I SAM-dependent methyltransferase [Rhodopila sp.]HVY17370.1 class I SAM-dependent methyltransferase [Rhodopila sp.]
MTDTTDEQLAGQYEAFPYPKRDPRDEAKRLIVGSPSHLREIDHWIFGATRPAGRPLNALVAGAGTGDATIMLAQQMASLGRPGTVTWLDRSAAARAVAQGRAAARGLGNVVWEQRSLLELPGSGLGPFDYIDCCGVLHHLPDPQAGLRALLSVLAPHGGLGLMVYAPHGRTGVYMMQDALRRLAPPAETPQQRLDVARRVMRHLPETQWLRMNRHFDDHINGGDAGLYDLLLNPRDRAYTVPELDALLASVGLQVACWVEPVRYDPVAMLPDPRLRARLEAMTPTERAAVAEALAGNMAMHIVYCVRADAPVTRADPAADSSVPVLRELDGTALAKGIRPDGTLVVHFDGLRVPVALPPLASAILPLVDGTSRVADIRNALGRRGIKPDAFDKAWRATFTALERVNRLLLAAPA